MTVISCVISMRGAETVVKIEIKFSSLKCTFPPVPWFVLDHFFFLESTKESYSLDFECCVVLLFYSGQIIILTFFSIIRQKGMR